MMAPCLINDVLFFAHFQLYLENIENKVENRISITKITRSVFFPRPLLFTVHIVCKSLIFLSVIGNIIRGANHPSSESFLFLITISSPMYVGSLAIHGESKYSDTNYLGT